MISCTQVSRSNATEIRGFKEALPYIEEHGVKVSTISTGGHQQIVKGMSVSNSEKHHELDPWQLQSTEKEKQLKVTVAIFIVNFSVYKGRMKIRFSTVSN